MPDPARPADGPSELPEQWRPQLPQPGDHPAPREELPPQWQHNAPAQPGPAGSNAPAPMRQPTQTLGTLMGDITRTGAWTAAERTSTILLFGDVKLDLREVLRPGETLTISTFTAAGDVRIAVPPGTRVELQGFTLLGSSRHDVDPEVSGVPDSGACVQLNATSLMGDVRVRTMPLVVEGKPPRGWRWTTKR